jgi:tetratricopeptide (TPR) repeat protein
MMGIGDQLAQERIRDSDRHLSLTTESRLPTLKILELGRTLWNRGSRPLSSETGQPVDLDPVGTGDPANQKELARARGLMEAGRLAAARTVLIRVIRRAPGESDAYPLLLRCGIDDGRDRDLEVALDLAADRVADDWQALEAIARCWTMMGRREVAWRLYRHAMEINPSRLKLYSGMMRGAATPGDYDEILEILKQHIEDHPHDWKAHLTLALCHERRGDLAAAEKACSRALANVSDEPVVLVSMGRIQHRRGHTKAASETFITARELDPQDASATLGLIGCWGDLEEHGRIRVFVDGLQREGVNPSLRETAYREASSRFSSAGMENLAAVYSLRADSLRSRYYPPVTLENFRKLRRVLAEREIDLICAQYPLRSLEPLRRVFNDPTGVIWVDNQRSFADALREHPYDSLFTDRFAGDFGHCTEAGNRILAENVATAILARLGHAANPVTTEDSASRSMNGTIQ